MEVRISFPCDSMPSQITENNSHLLV